LAVANHLGLDVTEVLGQRDGRELRTVEGNFETFLGAERMRFAEEADISTNGILDLET